MKTERKPAGYWNDPRNYDIEYNKLKRKLKRIPKAAEFSDRMIKCICNGKYDPKIQSYVDFVKAHKDIHRSHGFWNDPRNILLFYKELKQKLGRVPNFIELPHRMLYYIIQGKYNPKIYSYSDFVKLQGDKVNIRPNGFWDNSINYRPAYLELKKSLKRIPKSDELPSSMFKGIGDGKYDSKIRSYQQFLAAMGDLEIKTQKDLQITLKQDKKLAGLISFAQNYGKTSEIIQVLKQLFPNRFKDERKIAKMLFSSRVSNAMAPFEKPKGGGIPPVPEFLYELEDLPKELRKSRALEDVLYSIAVDEYQIEFNRNPKGVMNNLEKLANHEKDYISHLMTRVKSYYQGVLDFNIPGVDR